MCKTVKISVNIILIWRAQIAKRNGMSISTIYNLHIVVTSNIFIHSPFLSMNNSRLSRMTNKCILSWRYSLNSVSDALHDFSGLNSSAWFIDDFDACIIMEINLVRGTCSFTIFAYSACLCSAHRAEIIFGASPPLDMICENNDIFAGPWPTPMVCYSIYRIWLTIDIRRCCLYDQ